MKKLIVCLILMSSVLRMFASDSIRVSLLTCAPGTEIYALFGHTAIRYEDPASGKDWVFNYGMFSFDTPNFVMRFVRGETDYQLGVVPYRRFEMEYALRGSSVYQQTLNLTLDEKIELGKLLEENYLPANRVYRYNYFYDNCTTRARDKVEESLNGRVIYPQNERQVTFRDIIHEYTAGSEWSELGIDLCLGSEADRPIDERKQMFAPFYMLEAVRGAMIQRTDTIVPLLEEEIKIVDAVREDEPAFPFSPLTCSVGLWVMSVVIAVWGIKRGRAVWCWDVLLFGAQGVGGCVIAFLFFFSQHPTVGSNWMLALLNPVPLFYLPVMVCKDLKGKKDLYHWINTGYLMVFMGMMPFLPQEFHVAVIPLALSLLVTSASHICIYKKRH